MAEKGAIADAGAPPPPGQFGGPPTYGYAPAPGGVPPNAAATGYPPPPGYAPSVQTSGYPMAAGPGGYASVPGQPVVVYSGFAGQPGYGPGLGMGPMPPGTYVQMQGAPGAVVTSQVVAMAPVQPVNNSLIISSLVLSIMACVFALCCFLLSGLCALPAVILASIAMCSGPAMSSATAERKHSLARIAIVLAVLAFVTGAVLIICWLFIVLGSSNVSSSSLDLSRMDGGYASSCPSPKYSSSAHDCTMQRDFTFPSYDRSKSALSCCCIDGYGSRPGCYIDNVSTSRSRCNKCGPSYSDYHF